MTTRAGMKCNLCGSSEFVHMGNREFVRCKRCSSLERTRVAMLQLSRLGLPREEHQVLHFGPEPGLARYLESRVGAEHYHPKDIDPARYPHTHTQKFDLCSEVSELPDNTFHLIIHIHVLEHLPCNYTAVLYHLHRALHPDGLHLCGIPFLKGHFDETWAEVGNDERKRRFGQSDHVRRFGVDDIQSTLGMVFRVPEKYDLHGEFSGEELDQCNIPSGARSGFTPHTILLLRKGDLKLSSATVS